MIITEGSYPGLSFFNRHPPRGNLMRNLHIVLFAAATLAAQGTVTVRCMARHDRNL